MEYLAISYKIPAEPSRHRVAVWKALKDLGAVYLQDGVAMVPPADGRENDLRRLKVRIEGCGGQAALLVLHFLDAEDGDAARDQFRRAREEEYAALRDDARRLMVQMEWDAGRGSDVFPAERYRLEVSRLRRRLEKAAAKDVFSSPGADEAEESVRLAEEKLAGIPLPVSAPVPSQRRSPRAERAKKPAPPAEEPAVEAAEEPAVPPAKEEMPWFLF